MINVSDKSCRENQNTHFVFSNFFSKDRAVYEIICENMVERGRPQMTIWRMSSAYWIPMAIDTHLEYVIRTYCFYTVSVVAHSASMLHVYVVCCLYPQVLHSNKIGHTLVSFKTISHKHINLRIFYWQCILHMFHLLYRFLHPPVRSSLLHPNIALSTLFPHTHTHSLYAP